MKPFLRRALAIDEASFGAEHADVARDLNNLARLLQDTNRLAEAEFPAAAGEKYRFTLDLGSMIDGILAEATKVD